MIEVFQIRKSFHSFTAVDGVSFQAQDGAVTALVGRNGAGKTTTMRTICGLLKPERGRVLVDGIHVERHPLETRARLGVLPETRGIYPRLTAREHLQYFARLQGLNDCESAARCDDLVDLLEMGGFADRRAEGFSHGERTKVALAQALVHGPRNVLLDEPTSGLDVVSTRAIRALTARLRADGKCIVFSSHVMQEVVAVCDAVVVISDGTVVAEGTPEELCSAAGRQNLEDAFVALTDQETGP